jgi:L-alanine-DL-glutamate epimerase-like enolase superfamily enzyme
MRIAAVRAHVIRYEDTNDAGHWRFTVLVRVATADGVVGWGEGIAMWPEACKATKILIDEGLAPLLKEAGDITVAEAWEKMRAHAWWYGEGGIACFAYSALDTALWDIDGKLKGKPIYELLGGQRHESLPAYACNHVNKATRALNVAEVVGFKEQGFPGCKLGFAKRGSSDIGKAGPDNDVAFVRELRAALGSDFDIVIDIGNGVRWDRETGIATTRRMAEFDIGWIEEPFYPTQIDDYRALKAAVDVPIGAGEREFTVTDYRDLIATGTVDILGVDPARSEGITGFRKIDELCGAAGVTINAHAWSTAILTAASLQLSIASENARLLELKPFRVSVQTDLVDQLIWHQNGVVYAPSGPGLGIEVNEKLVEELTVG